jgi:hypothetical protein
VDTPQRKSLGNFKIFLLSLGILILYHIILFLLICLKNEKYQFKQKITRQKAGNFLS